jgi:hypothetical protein
MVVALMTINGLGQPGQRERSTSNIEFEIKIPWLKIWQACALSALLVLSLFGWWAINRAYDGGDIGCYECETTEYHTTLDVVAARWPLIPLWVIRLCTLVFSIAFVATLRKVADDHWPPTWLPREYKRKPEIVEVEVEKKEQTFPYDVKVEIVTHHTRDGRTIYDSHLKFKNRAHRWAWHVMCKNLRAQRGNGGKAKFSDAGAKEAGLPVSAFAQIRQTFVDREMATPGGDRKAAVPNRGGWAMIEAFARTPPPGVD